MPPSTSTNIRRMEFSVCLLVLGAVLSFLIWDAIIRNRHIAVVSETDGVTVSPPARDENSPTGYSQEMRSIILPARSMDGYHWIMQAQAMTAHGGERIRYVDYDGAPKGRPVHWASPYRWWLALLAWAGYDRDEPRGIAFERTASVAGPVLLGLALILFTPWLALRFAPSAGALFAVGCVATFPFYVDFVAGYVDHHGIASICALASVLFFLNRRSSMESGRRAAIASAVAGGIGLWISAATQIPVLIGIGLGAIAACWTERGEKSGTLWIAHPTTFRIWGCAGAAVSVAAYLAEYFPGGFGMRLEVNHPLHALTWFAGGEALCRLARIWSLPPGHPAPRDILAGISALAVIAVLPVTILFSKEHTFLVADVFLWRLHHDFIAEFQSLPQFLKRSGYAWSALGYCAPVLLLAPALWLGFSRKYSASTRATLRMAIVPALLILLLTWNQIRWWSLAYAMLVSVMAVFFRALQSETAQARRVSVFWALGCCALFVPGVIGTTLENVRASDWNDSDFYALAERDVAHWLRQRAGGEKVVVAASPTATTSLVFHGGLTGVGTLYWENLDGLKHTADFYAAPTADAAQAIAARCGLTHIVVISWDGFEGVYTRLARGLSSDAPLPTDTFITGLLISPVPPAWLRPLHFNLPPNPAFAGHQIRIYEITPPQSPLRSLINAAEYFLDAGRPDAAARLIPALEAHPQEPVAQIMLAYLAARRNDAEAFSHALAHLPENFGRNAPGTLDDEIRLVATLAAAERFEPARTVLEFSLRKITAKDLRQLSCGKLVELVSLTAASGLPWPDPMVRDTAHALLPPAALSTLKN